MSNAQGCGETPVHMLLPWAVLADVYAVGVSNSVIDNIPQYNLYCGVGLGLLVQMKEFALGGYKSLEAIPFWRSPTSPVGRLNGVMHR